MRAHGRKAGLHTGQDGQGEVLWPPAARFLCSQSHDASSFHPFLSFPSTKPLVLAELCDFWEGEHGCPSGSHTEDSSHGLSQQQGGAGPEFLCLFLKCFAPGHEKQRVLYRHERQISLWGNAAVGNRLKIVPK